MLGLLSRSFMQTSGQKQRQRILNLVKAGKPEAIAALLNHRLRQQGIEARVGSRQGCLLVLLDGEPVPAPSTALPWLRQIATGLDRGQIREIRVCGRARGEQLPAWMETIPVEGGVTLPDELEAWLVATNVQPEVRRKQPQTHKTRFLQFRLATGDPALLAVDYVREVFTLQTEKILPVPDMPPCVFGIHNWRGVMLWIVDLNQFLGLTAIYTAANPQPSVDVIAIALDQRILGLAIEGVETIEEFHRGHIQSPVGLFPLPIAAYVEGYISEANGTIVSAPALLDAPLWQRGQS